jgi:hypothetical protein
MSKKFWFILILALVVIVGTALGQTPATDKPVKHPVEQAQTLIKAIELLTPKTGEVWAEGSSQWITWAVASTGPVDSVKLVLYGQDSKPVVLARFFKENPLKWEWTKVSATTDHPAIEVQSYYHKKVLKDKHDFVIASVSSSGSTGPDTPKLMSKPTDVKSAIFVTTPNGTEKLTAGKSCVISWKLMGVPQAPDKVTYTIELSRNDGKDYEKIVGGISLPTNEYTWNVSGPASRTCRIKVTVKGVQDPLVLEDTSDASFIISE